MTDRHIDYDRDHKHPEGETYTERMCQASKLVINGIIVLILLYVVLLFAKLIPEVSHEDHSADPAAAQQEHGDHAAADAHEPPPPEHAESADTPDAAEHSPSGHSDEPFQPHYWAVIPFATLLLCIAILPLMRFTEHWWHHNKNRFLVAAGLGVITLIYYGVVHPGGIANHFTGAHGTEEGWDTGFAAFSNAIFAEFIPFILLLFSLYVISGGISLRGDLPAHPLTNCAFIGIGTLLASFIGTTGAAMVLIRPLLATNAERKHKVHTVVFFIFMVCNCGGLLLPIGDPPLFLGYLRGVPFLWTLGMWPYWLGVNSALIVIYYIWDLRAYKKEEIKDIVRDEAEVRPLKMTGLVNLPFLLGVVLCVAMIVPGKPFLGTSFSPPHFFREAAMMMLVILSLMFTHPHTRVLNKFDYLAITEVAALFCGIFLCMQVPVEILTLQGSAMGIDSGVKFFWATGILSSFLDNAPTYVVFFETARVLPAGSDVVTLTSGGVISAEYLVAISLGAVLMGANTYIGNGPNFMVKSIAEQSGIKMPSFFGYMLYSTCVLIPIFVIATFLL